MPLKLIQLEVLILTGTQKSQNHECCQRIVAVLFGSTITSKTELI